MAKQLTDLNTFSTGYFQFVHIHTNQRFRPGTICSLGEKLQTRSDQNVFLEKSKDGPAHFRRDSDRKRRGGYL